MIANRYEEANKKKGQFFTPRHVVEMCVRMLNPTQMEFVLDPACGSGGFLLHATERCQRDSSSQQQANRVNRESTAPTAITPSAHGDGDRPTSNRAIERPCRITQNLRYGIGLRLQVADSNR